jgi:antitoxin (DNA-binding transcriptional repressor) of toxin-antitoxin stability system
MTTHSMDQSDTIAGWNHERHEPHERLFRTRRGMTMSTTVTLADAQARLGELIDNLPAGEEVIIVKGDEPVAKLVGQSSPKSRLRPPPGLGKGMITIVSDDDDHLKDFSEYMP